MGVFIWNLPSLSTRFRKSPKRQSTVTADISANNSLFFAQKGKNKWLPLPLCCQLLCSRTATIIIIIIIIIIEIHIINNKVSSFPYPLSKQKCSNACASRLAYK